MYGFISRSVIVCNTLHVHSLCIIPLPMQARDDKRVTRLYERKQVEEKKADGKEKISGILYRMQLKRFSYRHKSRKASPPEGVNCDC